MLILAILFRPFDFIAPKTLKIILLSNLQILSVSDERFCSNLQILSVSDERFCSNLQILSVSDKRFCSNLQILSVSDERFCSNLQILSVSDESYSRNASCALNLISTFLFGWYIVYVVRQMLSQWVQSKYC